jgi:hypothetical protein
VAANAHGIFLFAGFGVALDILRLGRESGHRSDKHSGEGQQEFIHFARTISL